MSKTILHIVEAPGGVERFLVTLLTQMKRYPQFDQILICSATFDLEKFRGLVKDVVVIPEMQNAISLVNDTKAVFRVRREIFRRRPDIVYCHSSKAGVIGRVADLGIRNKVIYNAHGWAFNMKGLGRGRFRLYETVERMLAPLTDKIICISEYEKKSALEHRICGEEKLVVINNGIDFDEFRAMKPKSREELGIPRDAFVVGTISRLTAQKAPDVFVKMARIVRERIPEAFFIMVGDDLGDGMCRKETERQIRDLGMENSFLITGWVNDPVSYLHLFDVAVLLSRWEGFGLVIPEYMTAMKPIVATNVDAIPYVVGDAGLLVERDDFDAAARSVIRLYENEALRRDKIELGDQRRRLFSAQRNTSEHVSLMESILYE